MLSRLQRLPVRRLRACSSRSGGYLAGHLRRTGALRGHTPAHQQAERGVVLRAGAYGGLLRLPEGFAKRRDGARAVPGRRVRPRAGPKDLLRAGRGREEWMMGIACQLTPEIARSIEEAFAAV